MDETRYNGKIDGDREIDFKFKCCSSNSHQWKRSYIVYQNTQNSEYKKTEHRIAKV